jgi:hypothetical protein
MHDDDPIAVFTKVLFYLIDLSTALISNSEEILAVHYDYGLFGPLYLRKSDIPALLIVGWHQAAGLINHIVSQLLPGLD